MELLKHWNFISISRLNWWWVVVVGGGMKRWPDQYWCLNCNYHPIWTGCCVILVTVYYLFQNISPIRVTIPWLGKQVWSDWDILCNQPVWGSGCEDRDTRKCHCELSDLKTGYLGRLSGVESWYLTVLHYHLSRDFLLRRMENWWLVTPLGRWEPLTSITFCRSLLTCLTL